MTNQRTPMPWRICYTKFDNEVVGFHITCDPFGSLRPIVESGCEGWTPEQLIAHANLIAAAPELLAALKSATVALEQLVDIEAGSPAALTVAKARAAIAKAEGQ